ncbi:MAG TPA: ABC transporter permease [Symbiobacteriaceae bacterium]|jgi:ABC-2 type transport system permease protein|nr:ABC transporter permease [Symbiobacteriaceae bacterium]
MLQRLLALAQKEFIQIRRDRRTLAMMIALPMLWLLMFGYAFSFDVQEVTVAVVDNSGTEIGGLVADAFKSYDRFIQTDLSEPSEAGIRDAMYRDELQMGIIIPKGYADPGNNDQIQVLVDGSDLFAAQTGARLLQSALEPAQGKIKANLEARTKADVQARLTKELEARRNALLSQVPAPMKAQVEQQFGSAMAISPEALDLTPPAAPQLIPNLTVLYNPELKSANVMIPGLLGLVVMFITTMMTAMGVVREREYGTMEQLVVTPIKPFELMLGKLLPYLLVGALDFLLVYLAGKYLFSLTFMGNLPLFLGLSLLLVFTTLGLGLLLSTVAQNQQQAMQLALFVILPQILLSGLIFPLSSLPDVIRYVAYLLPFTHYVPIARGMFIKGQGLDLLWPQAVILAGYAVAVVTLASLRFRKRIA